METLAQLRDKRREFAELGVKLACVVQGDAEDAEELCGPYAMADVCVPDPLKKSYREFGLDRTTWMALVRPTKELMRRRKETQAAGFEINVRRSMKGTCDILLLPGAALVALGGKILWTHRGVNPADMPSADALLEIGRA
ncbi:MAG TPA: peroxiredoxin-like family protein, partial [Candidatus Acidoferrales bacterium]